MKTKQGTFELYLDESEQWRWRFRSVNGRIIFASSEGYADRRRAERGIELARGSKGAHQKLTEG